MTTLDTMLLILDGVAGIFAVVAMTRWWLSWRQGVHLRTAAIEGYLVGVVAGLLTMVIGFILRNTEVAEVWIPVTEVGSLLAASSMGAGFVVATRLQPRP